MSVVRLPHGVTGEHQWGFSGLETPMLGQSCSKTDDLNNSTNIYYPKSVLKKLCFRVSCLNKKPDFKNCSYYLFKKKLELKTCLYSGVMASGHSLVGKCAYLRFFFHLFIFVRLTIIIR